MTRRKFIIIALPVLAVVLLVVALCTRQPVATYQKDSGLVFGTSYNITYQSPRVLHDAIVAELDSIDRSLSPFNKASIITAVNDNRAVTLDERFLEVFRLATRINIETRGAFDITVAPLVNVWGFGFKHGKFPTDADVDSLLTFVGMDKVSLTAGKVVKSDPRTMLDCSAIAKGYAVDRVARRLQAEGCQNFLVEIGGEIVARGHNASGKPWTVGIARPVDDSLAVDTPVEKVLTITDGALATSGDYRNFYYKDGKKYAHTINPRTGRPAEQDILSATVLAPTCAEADAYATAFMTLGMRSTLDFLQTHRNLRVHLIYRAGNAVKIFER